MKNKRGQVAMWIIIALLIVGVIILFFTLRGDRIIEPPTRDVDNPRAFIEGCVIDSVRDAEEKMISQGGFVNPKNFKIYNDIKVTYLCENIGFFEPCINQHPLLLREMEMEIDNNITSIVNECYKDIDIELTRRGDDVSLSPESEMELNVSLAPGKVYVDISRRISITKGGETQTFEDMSVDIESPLHDFANVVNEIVNAEAQFCYFEYIGYTNLHPRFVIKKAVMSDSTNIYTIVDGKTDKVMNIAIRGCAIPA